MFSGLIIWHWITNCILFFGRLKQLSSAVYSSLCRVKDLQALWSVWHVCWCHSCSSHVWAFILTWWDFLGIASDVTKRHNLIASFLILWLLTIFLLPLCNFPWALGVGMFCRVSTGTGLHKSIFWLVVVSLNDLCLLQRVVSLMRGEDYTYLWA